MRVLISGARAPVALEWAAICMSHGHDVILTDSLQKPLGSFLTGIKAYSPTTSPRLNFPAYRQQILELIATHRIAMVIPTCEEVYYLAQIAEQAPEVHFFLPDRTLLYALHNKFTVFGQLQGLPEISFPKTRLITDRNHIQYGDNTILKPVYSRFGGQVIRDVSEQALSDIVVSTNIPWVQQEKISGTPVCSYAIFEHGRLIAQQVYLPRYCVNGSAASAFQPIEHIKIEKFMTAFGLRHKFHGQVSFDFIESGKQPYVIECNPRATSGLHLIAPQCTQLSPGIEFKAQSKEQLHHLGPVSLIAEGAGSLLKPGTWRDWWNGVNVMKRHRLRFGSQLHSLLELRHKAKQADGNWSTASTSDIEWNGEDLPS